MRPPQTTAALCMVRSFRRSLPAPVRQRPLLLCCHDMLPTCQALAHCQALARLSPGIGQEEGLAQSSTLRALTRRTRRLYSTLLVEYSLAASTFAGLCESSQRRRSAISLVPWQPTKYIKMHTMWSSRTQWDCSLLRCR